MENNSVDISIIIPCYNHGEFLPETLSSIQKQTFTKYEIIIIDDGSDSKTKKILSEISLPKTTIYHQSNSGPAANYGQWID